MANLEQIYGGLLRGPLSTKTNSDAAQWAGRTTLSSGSNTVTVSTTVVKSDSVILFGIESNTRQSSGFAQPIEVCSLTDGSYFAFTWADQANKPARDTTIMWMILGG